MKRSNLLKGISAAVVAFALCLGITGTAQAAKFDANVVQAEITQLGVDAPAISLKQSFGKGQVTKNWIVNYPAVPEGFELWFNVYNPDTPLESDIGSWKKDEHGRDIFQPNYRYVEYNEKIPKAEYLETFSRDSLTPGKKYIVAYYFASKAYEEACDAAWKAYYEAYYANPDPNKEWNYINPSKADYISPASAPISIEVTMEASVTTVVKSTSIQFDMDAYGVTGFEVYRKVGKKYQKVATVASNTYTDQGLLSKTEYSYKIRPYYKDENSGKIFYGKYIQLERTTKGSALQLKLTVQKTKNVKLSWKKVSGAVRYEIYRSAGYSYADEISKGDDNSFQQYKLIKTLGKGKKSYVDKKTVANSNKNDGYSYIVRAVLAADKKVKGDKDSYIQESRGISFSFDKPQETTRYTKANGDITVEWNKAYGVDGYIIFKYDQTAKDYVEFTRLGKNVTKYNFAAEVTTDEKGNQYQARYILRSYKGTKTSEGYIPAAPRARMGLVTGVKATKVANGIKVSWNPVANASYYKVYRVKAGTLEKDKTLGGYPTDTEALESYFDYDISSGRWDDEDYNAEAVQVTEYVGATTPVAVDAATYNAGIDAAKAADDAAYKAYDAAVDAYWDSPARAQFRASAPYQEYLRLYAECEEKADEMREKVYNDEISWDEYYDYYDTLPWPDAPVDPNYPQEPVYSVYYYNDYNKLDVNNGPYYYQNYSYAQDKFVTTSMVDYYGDIYTSDGRGEDDFKEGEAVLARTPYYAPVSKAESGRPQEGTTYQYYVVAYIDTAKTAADYLKEMWDGDITQAPAKVVADATLKATRNSQIVAPTPGTDTGSIVGTKTLWKNETTNNTLGCKTVGKATYTSVKAPAKAKISSLKTAKKTVTVKVKKVKNAKGYKIYRSTKKKGKYMCVGTSTKVTFKDTGLTAGTTYYYKVVAITKTESGADIEGKASAVKSIKAK